MEISINLTALKGFSPHCCPHNATGETQIKWYPLDGSTDGNQLLLLHLGLLQNM